jgi:two-component system, OmpR family, response regulator
MHVLLADDETGFRFSASVALRGAGFRVTVAGDGREAFSRIVEARAVGDPVQILVTDQMMPEMTGTELVGLLRAWGIQIPVVVVTAYNDFPPIPGSPPGSISELIEKPIVPEDLVACLKRVAAPVENPA